MTLCARCKRKIGAATRLAMAKAQARGVRVGRPKAPISAADLSRVRSGELTAEDLALTIGCSAMTVRRRLRESA